MDEEERCCLEKRLQGDGKQRDGEESGMQRNICCRPASLSGLGSAQEGMIFLHKRGKKATGCYENGFFVAFFIPCKSLLSLTFVLFLAVLQKKAIFYYK